MDLTALKKEARDKKTPDARLKEIAAMDAQLSRAVVKRAAALSSDMLEHLSRSPDMQTQRAVAAHTSSPVKVLEYLSGHGQWTVLKAVAENNNTPKEVIEKLSRHKRNTVRQAIVGRSDLTDEQMDRLAQDLDALVRKESIHRRFAKLSQVQQDRLLQDPDPTVRYQAIQTGVYAGRPDCANPALQDPDPQVRKLGVELSEFKVLKPHFAELAQDSEARVRIALIRRLDDPKILAQLALDESLVVQSEVAWNPFTPDAALTQLAQGRVEGVLLRLAQNPFCPAELLDEIAKAVNGHEEILAAIIENPSTRPETLRSIYKGGIRYFHYANAWGETPNWPADLLVEFMQRYYSYRDPDELPAVLSDQKHFDKIAGKKPPEQVLGWAATSSLYYHTDAANGNRHTPPEAIAAFVAKADPEERNYTLEDIASNPATPVPVLQRMLPDYASYMLKNVFLPDTILAQIPNDETASGSWNCHAYAQRAKDIRDVRKAKGIMVDDHGKVARK